VTEATRQATAIETPTTASTKLRKR